MATFVVECEHQRSTDLDAVVRAYGDVILPGEPLAHSLDRSGRYSVSIMHGETPDGLGEAIRAVLPGGRVELWTASTNREDGRDAFVTSVLRAGPGELALVDKRFDQEIEIGVPANNWDPNDWCLNLHRVCYLHSHLAPSRKRLVCLYVAVDVETVVSAYRLIPVAVARVLNVRLAPAITALVEGKR